MSTSSTFASNGFASYGFPGGIGSQGTVGFQGSSGFSHISQLSPKCDCKKDCPVALFLQNKLEVTTFKYLCLYYNTQMLFKNLSKVKEIINNNDCDDLYKWILSFCDSEICHVTSDIINKMDNAIIYDIIKEIPELNMQLVTYAVSYPEFDTLILDLLNIEMTHNINKITETLLNTKNNHIMFLKTYEYILINHKVDIDKINIKSEFINYQNISLYHSFGYSLTKQNYLDIINRDSRNKIKLVDDKYIAHFGEEELIDILMESKKLDKFQNIHFKNSNINQKYLNLMHIIKPNKKNKKNIIKIDLNDEMINLLINYNSKTIKYLLANIPKDKINIKLVINIIKSLSQFSHSSDMDCTSITKFLE